METTKTKKTVERKFEKVTVEIIKLSGLTLGESIEGTYIAKSEGPYIDKNTGEESTLTRLQFERDDGTKFITFEDAGLRNAMANAMVEKGDYLKIVKLEQVATGGGRKSNNYDLFVGRTSN